MTPIEMLQRDILGPRFRDRRVLMEIERQVRNHTEIVDRFVGHPDYPRTVWCFTGTIAAVERDVEEFLSRRVP